MVLFSNGVDATYYTSHSVVHRTCNSSCPNNYVKILTVQVPDVFHNNMKAWAKLLSSQETERAKLIAEYIASNEERASRDIAKALINNPSLQEYPQLARLVQEAQQQIQKIETQEELVLKVIGCAVLAAICITASIKMYNYFNPKKKPTGPSEEKYKFP